MTMKTQSNSTIFLLALTLGMLSACGESDIEEIERRELASAQRDIDAAPDSKPVTDQEPGAGAAVPGIDTTALELVFSDEFNDTAIDTAKWVTSQQWGPDLIINDELQ